jgi:hypothetical protein
VVVGRGGCRALTVCANHKCSRWHGRLEGRFLLLGLTGLGVPAVGCMMLNAISCERSQ